MNTEPATKAPDAMDLIDDATLALSKISAIAEGLSAMMMACANAPGVNDRAVYAGMSILLEQIGEGCETAAESASKAFETMARSQAGER